MLLPFVWLPLGQQGAAERMNGAADLLLPSLWDEPASGNHNVGAFYNPVPRELIRENLNILLNTLPYSSLGLTCFNVGPKGQYCLYHWHCAFIHSFSTHKNSIWFSNWVRLIYMIMNVSMDEICRILESLSVHGGFVWPRACRNFKHNIAWVVLSTMVTVKFEIVLCVHVQG